MTEIQIVNAMNQSVINKLTEFKNKELKKDDLNNFMLINLTYILKKSKEIKSKNEKIKKEQDIEIKKSLSKIKSYKDKFVFNQEEIEKKPIMKKMVNQTLDVYISLSEISFTTEMKLYNEKVGKSKFNESILFKDKEEKENDNDGDDKQIQFEEAPITFVKFINDREKIKYKENYFNHVNDKFVELINKYDEDIITKKDDSDNDQYNTNLFYELINSFDEEDKEDLDLNNTINLDFKEIKSTFYFDDIFPRKSLRRNSNEIYITSSSLSGSTSFGSGNGSFSQSHPVYKEIYDTEFASYLPYDNFKKNLKQMSVDYLRYMLVVYSNNINKAKKWFYLEEKMFINLMKSFILKIGISSKKLYEKIFQSLINGFDKENICSFENFLKSFAQILKFKEENSVIKYKFIMSLFRLGEEDINVKHINIFLQLIKGEAMYDIDIWDELNRGLILKYDKIYPNDPGNNFRFDKILICLESFFDKSGK